jgi:hypothetical protein
VSCFPQTHPAAALIPSLCPVLSLDLMDISGELQRDISHDILKTRLTPTGTVVHGSQVGELRNDIDKLNEQRTEGYCGSCYGGEPDESGCCNSCDSVREAYTRKGWSFGNPGGIDQVRSLRDLVSHLRLHAGLRVLFFGGCWFSALRNIGPTISRSKQRKVAMLPVSCG